MTQQNLKLYYQGKLKVNVTQENLDERQVKLLRDGVLKKLRHRHASKKIAESDIHIYIKEVK